MKKLLKENPKSIDTIIDRLINNFMNSIIKAYDKDLYNTKKITFIPFFLIVFLGINSFIGMHLFFLFLFNFFIIFFILFSFRFYNRQKEILNFFYISFKSDPKFQKNETIFYMKKVFDYVKNHTNIYDIKFFLKFEYIIFTLFTVGQLSLGNYFTFLSCSILLIINILNISGIHKMMITINNSLVTK